MSEFDPIRRRYHSQGLHLTAEWETLKNTAVNGRATTRQTEDHRHSFFMGAFSLWRILRATQDADNTVKEIDAELRSYIESVGPAPK